MKRVVLSIFTAFLMASCGGNEADTAADDAGMNETENMETTEETMNEEAPKETGGDEAEAQSVNLELKTVGETMATMEYTPNRLTVPAGAQVNLTLVNDAEAEAMIHNVVFIQRGKQDQVSSAGLAAGKDAGFVPEDSEFIIAASELAYPGETKDLAFTAPSEPGTYQFICTYPGHTAMKGILIVQ